MPIVIAGGMAEVISALALLLLVWAAATLLVRPLAIVLSNVPFVGGQIANALYQGAQVISDWALGWARVGVAAMVAVVSVPVRWAESVVVQAVAIADGIVSNIAWLLGLLSQLTARVAAVALSVGSLTLHLVASIAAVVATIPVVAARVARAIVAAEAAALRSLIAAAVRAGQLAADNALRLARAAVAAAEAVAAGNLARAVATMTAALHAVAVQDAQAIGRVEAEATKALNLVAPLVAANVLGQVLTIEREIDTLRRECIDPTCSVIGPQLPVLTELMDLATLLIVGAAVGEAVANPQGAAQAAAGIAAEVHAGASELLGAFAGVHA